MEPYARVSTFDQEPENQLADLRRYVTARGWTAKVWSDLTRSVGGSVPGDDRHAFQDGRAHIQAPFIDPSWSVARLRSPEGLSIRPCVLLFAPLQFPAAAERGSSGRLQRLQHVEGAAQVEAGHHDHQRAGAR